MLIKYKFSINGHSVNPFYKDDISKDYELESQQRFYRASLSGSLKFLKLDFEWLVAQPFNTEFVLLIEKSNDGGIVWTNYLTGAFYKTDVKWDDDNKKAEVQIDIKDQYTEVLAGLEKEYDLIKLSPVKTALTLQKRPLIQLYVPGSSVVSCFLGGNSWEQDVAFEVTDLIELVNTYLFALASTLHKVWVSGSGAPSECVGDYVGETVSILYGRNLTDQSDQVYKFTWNTYAEEIPPGTPTLNTLVDAAITRISDNVIMFQVVGQLYTDGNITLNAVGGGATGTMYAYVFSPIKVYTRYLLDVDVVSGLNTYVIPVDDFVSNNRNYKRAIGYAIDQVTITANAKTIPTKYGLRDDGYYFDEPNGFPSYYKYYPVAKSTWGLSSIWFNFDTLDHAFEEDGRKTYMMKDSIMISNAIKVLLNIIDSSVTHEGTVEYSEFLYGTLNPITYNSFRVMITQKSNILAGNYDRPAQKAPVTLSSIMKMLRDTFKLYWFIDSNKKFRIEHISWFKNGGAYSGSPQYTADLTTLINAKNKKPWGFVSSKYEYDKADLAERFEFAWMDDVTEGFEGYPIEINSKFIQRGKIEDINVSGFTPDVDYMLLNPEAINMDGFALFAAITINIINPSTFRYGEFYFSYGGFGSGNNTYGTTDFILVTEYGLITEGAGLTSEGLASYVVFDASFVQLRFGTDTNKYVYQSGDVYVKFVYKIDGDLNFANSHFVYKGNDPNGFFELPYIQRDIDGADLLLQNGFMSWIYLHPNYWTYDLPSSDVTINNGEYVSIHGVERKKKQKVMYPSIEDPDPLKLIKTGLGDGQIEKLSINLSSRMNNIQLKYDTEQ